jgi:hypothetical protein
VSAEVVIFILRFLAGLSLLGFMLTLFVIVWRNMRQVDRQLLATRTTHGYLICQARDSDESDSVVDRYPLHAITTLGRSASNTVVVKDDFASAEHARIVLEHGRWWLEDRRSRNGTRLNDAAIDQRTVLTDGDVIGIGKYSYRLALGTKAVSSSR